MQLTMGELSATADEREVELVERKGIGHPDTICDALAESFSAALCRFYEERFGAVLHHNVDKALLCGGASRPRFGGGSVLEPIDVILAGRATARVRDVDVPIEEIAIGAAREWLGRHLHALDHERHVRISCRVRAGSSDLVDLFLRAGKTGDWLANDTSFGAGWAPLSRLERAVLAASAELERAASEPSTAWVGEDSKVMGIRQGSSVQLVVACAFVDRWVREMADYVSLRGVLARRVVAAASREVPDLEMSAIVNAADDPARGSIYLTVTGTSAEAGDDGQVGRGNRVGGLITPYRPTTIEAAAGKNPVAHVGKIYNLVARAVAEGIVARAPDVRGVEVRLVSQIGRPVRDPMIVDVRAKMQGTMSASSVAGIATDVVERELGSLERLARDVIAGRTRVF